MAKECWYHCADCGERVKKRKKQDREVLCLECGIARGRVAALEMHFKAGGAYTDWQNSAGPRGRPRLDSR